MLGNNNSGGGYKGKSNYNRRDNDADGERRPYRRRDDNGESGDGERRPYRRREENGECGDGERRPYRRRDDAEGGDGERRPNRRREDGEGGADGDGEKRREIYVPDAPTNDESEIFGSTIKTGINFGNFEKIPVKVTENVAKGLHSFKESGLREYLLQNVEKAGYQKLTPIQKYAIPTIMNGLDLVACAQTGSGKVRL